ncbi:MAG: arginine--tRNA ligase [Candidatus Micrarchaeota archaeon]|nr:arginine--tRNA ligase [Candidatus Micrarchaeota archaeon]
MFLRLRARLAKALSDAAGCDVGQAEASLAIPKGQFGDVASSMAFHAAKKHGKSPAEEARELAGKILLPDWVDYAKADGPYVNFILSDAFYSQLLAHVLNEKERFGMGQKKQGKTIVEFPSVNPNKPWHIGHLRNAVLGDAVARILEFSGENVERIDYIDDLGLQVAQSFWGYLNLGKKPIGKLDLWLGEQYVEVSRRFESDENVQKQVRELLKAIEHGESKEAKEARKLVESCVAAQYETAFKFGIYHDVLIFESDIVRTIFQEGMELLKANNAISKETEGKNAGCWVAKLQSKEFSGMESPDKILIRSDGTATYTGKDVIFQLWKFGIIKSEFAYSRFMHQPNGHDCYMSSHEGRKMGFGRATRVINVIGMEQAYPQKAIREILRLIGFAKEAENSIHLSYEHVWLQDAKFSGRQGTWIGYTADELYSEGLVKAESKIKEDVVGAERGKIATAVASGGIRFALLKTTPEKKIVFRWEEALSLEGDSAPYVMYAHARAHKIFSKAGEGKPSAKDLALQEKELLKKIMAFDLVVQDAAKQLRPHLLADYSLELATAYNKFYNACPIIGCQEEEKRQMRLAINAAALIAMRNAMGLLGIEALEKM